MLKPNLENGWMTKMEEQIIEDEYWDYYSGMPNPKWYEANDSQV